LTDFIPADVIEGATDWGVRERPRAENVRYVAFIDAAGGAGGDAFTLGIGHKRSDGVAVLDVLRERVPRFVPAAVVAEYCDLLKRYGVREVRGDRFSGAWCSDELMRHGIRYLPAAMTKSEIYLASLPLLLAGRVLLLDDEKLRKQLSGLERRVHSGGRESVDHVQGPGHHDDVANAALGVLVVAAAGHTILVAPIIVSGPWPDPGGAVFGGDVGATFPYERW
jgi:hypothetical protein